MSISPTRLALSAGVGAASFAGLAATIDTVSRHSAPHGPLDRVSALMIDLAAGGAAAGACALAHNYIAKGSIAGGVAIMGGMVAGMVGYGMLRYGIAD